MGGVACRKLRKVVENTLRVLGIELLAACQAIDLCAGSGLSAATQKAYDVLRSTIPELGEDRVMYPDMNGAYLAISSGKIVREVESVSGPIFEL